MQKKLKVFLRKIPRFLLKIENLVIFLLVIIILTKFAGSFFIFSKFKDLRNDVISLNIIYNNINNKQTELNERIKNIQSSVMRLQARIYRSDTDEEK
ncbi:hypothetical protein DRH27_00800 [Candidatus Falkowbacteria bacterium]|nr:MAG: hypothetical protein DRH27_00800 [Candidatus Falkowbacteria bacterium]